MKKYTPKKPWITQAIFDRMEERRKWKNVNNEEGKRMYRHLNNHLRRETDKAREKWLDAQCTEIEKYDKAGRSDLMYAKAKELGKKYKPGNRTANSILDSQGVVLKDPNQIEERWIEYFETLYDTEHKPTTCCLEDESEVDEEAKGQTILLFETECSINKLKKIKHLVLTTYQVK